MRVAFYGRFSSDRQKDSSIDQQYRNCERFAEREGWTITQRYEDRGISGTKDDTERPGYQQMLTDLKAKAFKVLLVDDFSRLSRDKRESEQTRRRIIFNGARLIGVSDGIDTSQKAHKIQAMAKDLVNDIFIDDLKEKIKRGMVDQAEKGYWNGGRVYGYRLEVMLDDRREHQIGTKLVVDPEQAKWVKWIFEHYADGWSALQIVTELNRVKVPPPGAGYKGRRPAGWNFLSLHGVLHRGTGLLNNTLYKGIHRWNRTYRQIDPDTKREVERWRDQSEWIEKPMPHLRIVSDELWEQAHARRVAVSQSVQALRTAEECKVRSTGSRPKYLFSGLLSCGVCHKPFTLYGGNRYACSTVTTQGIHRCTNTLKVERALVEELLLEPIQTELFTEDGYEVLRASFMEGVEDLYRSKMTGQHKTRERLTEVERELANLMAAIKAGILTPTTKDELEKAEAERERLKQQLEAPSKPNGTLPAVLPDMSQWFEQFIGDLAKLGPHQIDKVRGIIKDLVGGTITLKPTKTSQGKKLAALITPDYLGLARQLVGLKFVILAPGIRLQRR